MPRYEYRCQECGVVFEVQQKFSDLPLEVHDGCGGSLEKLLSAPAFQFKGSGWYVTDYARSGGKKKDGDAVTPDAKPDTAKTGTDTTAKTESKPARASTSSEKSG